MSEKLQSIIQTIDGRQAGLEKLDTYYRGDPPLSYLSPEAAEALDGRLRRMGSNFCRLAVGSIAERLRVTGFSRGGETDPGLWDVWLANDMDQQSSTLHREALTLGAGYCIVWADSTGAPSITVESAHQVAVVRDPGSRQVVAAVKRWNTSDGARAVLYEPGKITHYASKSSDATAASQFRATETLENPLGVVPVVEFRNSDRLLDEGVSELRDIAPLQDALNKLLSDLMVGSENYARPRRWATGVELEEDEDGEAVNPYPEGNRTMVSESADTRFGQLPASDLASYETAIHTVVSQIQAVSALPDHYAGVTAAQPPNADGLRAAEASLTARVEQRQATFGRSWEQVMNLVHAILTSTPVERAGVRVGWADPATRSTAQEADAVVKLFQAGLLPASTALSKLGYSDAEVDSIRAARRAESLDQSGTDIEGLLS